MIYKIVGYNICSSALGTGGVSVKTHPAFFVLKRKKLIKAVFLLDFLLTFAMSLINFSKSL